MAAISVLLVAPQSDLEWVAVEVETISNLASEHPERLNVRQVRAPATLRSVTEAIGRYGWCDVLVFSTHGNESGVVLDDGQIGVADVLMLTEMARCRLLILNSCSSIAIAGDVVKATRSDVICTIEEQPDRRAWQVSTGVLRELVRGGGSVAAFMRTARFDRNSQYLRSLND